MYTIAHPSMAVSGLRIPSHFQHRIESHLPGGLVLFLLISLQLVRNPCGENSLVEAYRPPFFGRQPHRPSLRIHEGQQFLARKHEFKDPRLTGKSPVEFSHLKKILGRNVFSSRPDVSHFLPNEGKSLPNAEYVMMRMLPQDC